MLSNLSIFSILFSLYFFPSLVLNWCKQSQFTTNRQIKYTDTSPNGRFLAVALTNKTIKIYNTRNYQQIYSRDYDDSLNVLRFSPDGKYLAIGKMNDRVNILNAFPPFSSFKSLDPDFENVYGVDWTADSQKLIACGGKSSKGYLTYFNVSGSNSWDQDDDQISSSEIAIDCRVSPVNGLIAVSLGSKIQIYNFGMTRLTTIDDSSTTYYKLAQHYINPIIFFIDNDGNQYTRLDSAYNPTIMSGTSDILYALQNDPNGKYSATGGKAKKLYIYNSTYQRVQTWNTIDQIKSISFTRPGNYKKLFVGDQSGNVLVLALNCSKNCGLQYFYSGQTCVLCSTSLPNCISCINATVCDVCINGFYVDPTTLSCLNCTIFGCMTCINSERCTECNVGFYLSSNTCKRCNSNIDGCLMCSNSSTCNSCDYDYVLNISTNKCQKCNAVVPNCVKCKDNITCFECQQGYYPQSNGSCVLCDSNCVSCHGFSNNCSQCTKGYYVNNYNCIQCSDNCLSCNNSDFCFQCQNGMFQNSNGTCQDCPYPCLRCEDSVKCYNCAEGYYLFNGSCQNCIINNCAICNSSSYCVNCLAGFYLLGNNSCRSCPQQYPNCEYCSSTVCQSCQLGYFLNTSNLCQHCSSKMFKCQKCSSQTDCVSCVLGFYLTELTGNSSCKSCQIGCQICQDVTICKKCYQNYYLDSNQSCISCIDNCIQCLNQTYCEVCQSGYYVDQSNNTCTLCNVNISNCLECLNNVQCINCQIGFYLNSTTKQCDACLNDCSTCANSSKCTTCFLGYYLTTGATPTCQPCSQECTECTALLVCQSCKVGYWLETSSKTCKLCTLKNRYCRLCTETTCFLCIDGYYLDNTISPPNNKCVSCLQKIEGCIQCNQSNYCFECDYGYYLQSNQTCVSCSILLGCQSCINSTYCEKCIKGYFLDSNLTCQVCDFNCKTCDSAGNCSTCELGFYLNGNDCIECNYNIQGCLLCTNNISCIECMNGYYPLNSTSSICITCRSSMIGCLYCNSSSYCTKCQSGYYLNTTTNLCEVCTKTMQGCQICVSNSICSDCQTGYYLSAGNSSCLLCGTNLIGCLSCYNNSICEICKTGFYINYTDYKCYKCSSYNTGCYFCQSNSTNQVICNQCSGGYYLANSQLCSPCQMIGCQICNHINPNICISCDSLYFKNATSCTKCSDVMQGCNQCNNGVVCKICDVGYYRSQTNQTCYLCQQAIQGCGKCDFNNGTLECLECKSSFLINSVNKTCMTCYEVIQGCSYCKNSTQCIGCGNGYYKNSTTGKCDSCTNLPGCLLCMNQAVCEYCTSNYYIDNALKKCILCQQAMPHCLTCLVSTKCMSCQSGYEVNQNKCDPVTASASQKVKGLKLITQYINQNILSHILYISDSEQIDQSFNLNNSCSLYLTNYNSLWSKNVSARTIKQIKLNIIEISWIKRNQLLFLTNNPTNISDQNFGDMGLLKTNIRRLTPTDKMAGMKVSLQMDQKAVNAILPNMYQTGDLMLDYSLDQPEFYVSFVNNSGKGKGKIYCLFGYVVSVLMVLLYAYKTYKAKFVQHVNNHCLGELMSHTFAIKTVGMTLYPLTYQFYYFCYGFMLFDFPWFNFMIGKQMGQRYDFVPKQLIMHYFSLNIVCTFAMALGVYTVLNIGRFLINKKNKFGKSKFTKILYSVFLFGLIYAGSLSIQGAFYNPIVSIDLNALFYILGITIYLLLFSQIIYSVRLKRYQFYKIRILIKASLLSIGHVNSVIIVPVAILSDILLAIIQYYVIQKPLCKNTRQKYLKKFWLLHNILLNICLVILFVLPNSFLSIIMTVIFVSFVLIIEILTTFTRFIQRVFMKNFLDNQINLDQRIAANQKKALVFPTNNSKLNRRPTSINQNAINQSMQTLMNQNYFDKSWPNSRINVWGPDSIDDNLERIGNQNEINKDFTQNHQNNSYNDLLQVNRSNQVGEDNQNQSGQQLEVRQTRKLKVGNKRHNYLKVKKISNAKAPKQTIVQQLADIIKFDQSIQQKQPQQQDENEQKQEQEKEKVKEQQQEEEEPIIYPQKIFMKRIQKPINSQQNSTNYLQAPLNSLLKQTIDYDEQNETQSLQAEHNSQQSESFIQQPALQTIEQQQEKQQHSQTVLQPQSKRNIFQLQSQKQQQQSQKQQ